MRQRGGISNPNKFEFALVTKPEGDILYRLYDGERKIIDIQNGKEIYELSGYGKEIKTLIESGITEVQFNGNSIKLEELVKW